MKTYKVEVWMESPHEPFEASTLVMTLTGKYEGSGEATQAALRAIHLPGNYQVKVYLIDHVISLTYSIDQTV